MKPGVYFAKHKGRVCFGDNGPVWPYLAYIVGEAPFLKCETIVSLFTLRCVDEEVSVLSLEFGPMLNHEIKGEGATNGG